MTIVVLKPLDGAKVRDPQTKQYLPEDGKRIEMSSYWRRRISEGVVAEVGMSVPRPDKSAARIKKPEPKEEDL